MRDKGAMEAKLEETLAESNAARKAVSAQSSQHEQALALARAEQVCLQVCGACPSLSELLVTGL